MLASQAKTAVNDAHINLEEAKVFREQAKTILIALSGIKKRAYQLERLLYELDIHLVDKVNIMENIIKNKGCNFQVYSNVEQEEIYKCVKIAKTIKTILDSQLLLQEGTLNEETKEVVQSGKKYIAMLEGI